jgi:SAM-dependent methyltransferase
MIQDTIIRYGKSLFDILNIKADFFFENQTHLNENNRIANIYKQQPLREDCKLCGTKLPEQKDFTSHSINYFLCDICGHLNGAYQDTKEFVDIIYSGSNYGINYNESTKEQYLERLDAVYSPKARFFKDSLKTIEEDYKGYKILDVGCGSGYMVGALRRLGFDAKGVEVSETQVQYGNNMLEGNYLQALSQDDIISSVSNTNAQILCFIGVFEHLCDLSGMLREIKVNTHIKYVFFSVPMYSLSCIFESIFPEVFNRQLGGGHTHLFSRKSLEWMYKKYDLIQLAKWDFGTDLMDLYRSIIVMLKKQTASEKVIKQVGAIFKENIDSMELVLDRSAFSSETHVLIKVDHSKLNENVQC